MKEVRPPKRPLIFYYCVAMLILLLFNFLAMPWMARQQIQEVDYGTFMDMARKTRIWAKWRSRSRRTSILFTNKDETAVYSTGMIPDPDLTHRCWRTPARSSTGQDHPADGPASSAFC